MKILVTGGTGFIGSWLVRKLTEKNDVEVLVKKDDPLGLGNLEDIQDKIKITYGDIRNYKDVSTSVKEKDVIFHLAAITQVLHSIENPKESFEVNVEGTFNVLEAIRKENKEAFLVFASTDKVYGEPIYLPIDEKHPLLGKSPYDASKIAADRLVYSYHKTYGTKMSIVRCSNIYGGADSNILRAAPDFIYSILSEIQPIIRGHGNHERDFLYIDDAVNGYIKIVENMEKSNGHAFNFGTTQKTKIKELAEMIVKESGKNYELEILNQSHKGEIEKQYLDYSKAKKILNWEPKVSLEEGLKKTIEWYIQNTWWKKVIKKVSEYYGIETKRLVSLKSEQQA